MLLIDIINEDVSSDVMYHAMSTSISGRVEKLLLDLAAGGSLIGRTNNRINNLANRNLEGDTHYNRFSGEGDAYHPDEDQDGNTDHVDDKAQKNGEIVSGTSFTRSKHLALKDRQFGDIVFEVDKRGIAKNHKIVPIDDLQFDRGTGRRSEAEEFVVGNIKNFAKYIRTIHIRQDGRTVLDHGDKSKSNNAKSGQMELESALMILQRKFPHIKINGDHRAPTVNPGSGYFKENRLHAHSVSVRKIQTQLDKGKRKGTIGQDEAVRLEAALDSIRGLMVDMEKTDGGPRIAGLERTIMSKFEFITKFNTSYGLSI